MKSLDQIRPQLLPHLKKIEKARVPYRILTRFGVYIIQFFVVGFLLYVFVGIFWPSGINYFMSKAAPVFTWFFYIPMITMPGFFIYAFYNYKIQREQTALFSVLLPAIHPSFTYSSTRQLHREKIKKSKLFHISDKESSRTGVFSRGLARGKLGETELEFTELTVNKNLTKLAYIPFYIHLYAVLNVLKPLFMKKKSMDFYAFRGLFAVADFHKKLKSHLVILPDYLEKKLGYLAKNIQSMNFKKEELIYLENPEFEKAFKVYGTDQLEARLILTPSFMERVLQLKNKIDKPLLLSFSGSKMYLAVRDTSGFFKLDLTQNVLTEKAPEKICEEINFCIDSVEELNKTFYSA